MRPNADYWIRQLQLTSHVEGGAFREVYRSELKISQKALPVFFQGDRNISTSIYFLLSGGQFSAFHRIASDELWHFYFGDTLLIYEIGHSGVLTVHRLGTNIEKGESFQAPDTGRQLVCLQTGGRQRICVGRLYGIPGIRFCRIRAGRPGHADKAISSSRSTDRKPDTLMIGVPDPLMIFVPGPCSASDTSNAFILHQRENLRIRA